MSYFNDDQKSWTHYLASLPPEAKCDCGWDRRGECPVCPPERGGRVKPSEIESAKPQPGDHP